MATFDQLPAEQRAILELVLQRGQAYADLADMLGMPTARVRELAREALTDLSPHSAARVDREWRGQVADYLLGQQTGPEGTATRGHLKRSEAARLWALSLLDSLDHLYRDGEMPVVPEGEAPLRERTRERTPRVTRSPLGAGRLGGGRVREPRASRPLSPAAEAIVRRRRIAGAAGSAALVLFALLVWPIGLLTGDDGKDKGGSGQASGGDQRVLGQLLLRPVSGEKGVGIAIVTETNGERLLVVQARGLKRTRQGEAYEVWLYNSPTDARSMGAQLTDKQGNYQGAGRLPADYTKYRYLDLSREKVDQNAAHSGDSVLRGRIADLAKPAASSQTQAPTDTQPQTQGGSPLPGG
jgi:hypothetical protein